MADYEKRIRDAMSTFSTIEDKDLRELQQSIAVLDIVNGALADYQEKLRRIEDVELKVDTEIDTGVSEVDEMSILEKDLEKAEDKVLNLKSIARQKISILKSQEHYKNGTRTGDTHLTEQYNIS